MNNVRNFTLLSIDESRHAKKVAIRNVLFDWTEHPNLAVNGYIFENIEFRRKWNLLSDEWLPSKAEEGIWYSQIEAWRYAAENNISLLVVEDDAMFVEDFTDMFDQLWEQVPDDCGFFTAFVPNNQYGDFHWEYTFNERGDVHGPAFWREPAVPAYLIGQPDTCRVYQGYSCVANVITPLGGRNLLDCVERWKMFTPVDCFMYQMAKAGYVNGYGPQPHVPRIVDIDWSAPTTRNAEQWSRM